MPVLSNEMSPTTIPDRKRDKEREPASLVDRRVHSELAAQLLDTARDDGQAEAEARCGARLGLRRLDLLELAEDALELAGRNSASSVAHDDLDSDLL
jgi:hypothetical protein